MFKISILSISLLASPIMANPDIMHLAFKAVAISGALNQAVEEARSEGFQLAGLKHVESYRCKGCFGFDATFIKNNDESNAKKIIKLQTMIDFDNGNLAVTFR